MRDYSSYIRCDEDTAAYSLSALGLIPTNVYIYYNCYNDYNISFIFYHLAVDSFCISLYK
jgi:hypothetical protein